MLIPLFLRMSFAEFLISEEIRKEIISVFIGISNAFEIQYFSEMKKIETMH